MILAYHEIGCENSGYRYGVSSETLTSHLVQVQAVASPSAQLTFDDGHISHFEQALPQLDARKLKGIFFVTSGWTGVRDGYMNADQLRVIHQSGHEIGAHGWSHKMLTLCSPGELFDELRWAREALEDRIGSAVTSLSIPHGRWNKKILQECAAAGYQRVYISEPRFQVNAPAGLQVHGRLMVTRSMTAHDIQRALENDPAVLVRAHRQDRGKRFIRSVVGERAYHAVWQKLAKQENPRFPRPPLTRPRRVLQLISTQGFYGAENVALTLSAHLDQTGYRSTLGVIRNSQSPHIELAERAKAKNIKAEILPCTGRFDNGLVEEIRGLVYREGIELIHTHGFKSNFYGALAVRSLGVPLVSTCHIDWPDRGLALHAYHALDRLILRRFASVVAVSSAIARSLRRTRIAAAKLTTVPNGLDLSPFFKLEPAMPVSADRDVAVGLVGRLTPQKGHTYLLAAAKDILSEFPRTRFLFFGDGPEQESLREQSEALGLGEQVEYAGSRLDMAAVYRSLDLVVLPSVNEGLPMVLIEALAAGRPVVASLVGDVGEVIQNRRTGLTVPAKDVASLAHAIRELLRDQGLRESVITNGRQWVVQNFSAERMTSRYRELYEEVLSGRGRFSQGLQGSLSGAGAAREVVE